ncbi:hypothetical protein OESDEN_17334 [Oesophagostomum dentatum]|uniref:Uncharacterized protein n=1 Tax=Oesophagostomum dentatum TaxID=61180 RepID=A0A0B1SHG6_OESDE|nr:hypothetical protein OESDEN_17334 [Oesophagostomum dentatum]
MQDVDYSVNHHPQLRLRSRNLRFVGQAPRLLERFQLCQWNRHSRVDVLMFRNQLELTQQLLWSQLFQEDHWVRQVAAVCRRVYDYATLSVCSGIYCVIFILKRSIFNLLYIYEGLYFISTVF